MYEKPILIKVGNAENVILGVALSGFDLDGTYITGGSEFEDDADAVQS